MLNRLTLDDVQTAFAETGLKPRKSRFLSPTPAEDWDTCQSYDESEYGCVLGAVSSHRIGREEAADLYYHKGMSHLCAAIDLDVNYAEGLYCGWDGIAFPRMAGDGGKTGYEDGQKFRHAIMEGAVA